MQRIRGFGEDALYSTYAVEVFTYLLFMPVGGAVVAIVNGCKMSLKCVLVACNYACVPLLP